MSAVNKVSLARNAQPIGEPNATAKKSMAVTQPLRVNLLKDNVKKAKLDFNA